MADDRTRADSGRGRLERLLADAAGYAVISTTGAPVGRVIWLTFELEALTPAGLRVQPEDALSLAPVGSWEIPAARVTAVTPARREVVVALPALQPGRLAA